MSNTQAPFGLRPVRNLSGAAPTYQTSVYQILSTNSNKFGTGDVVKFSSGYIDKAATTDHPILGVFQGCEYYDTYLQKKVFFPAWLAPTTAVAPITAYVIDDCNVIFEVQSSGAAITIANVGQTAKFTGNGAPSTTTGISTLAIDQATLATTTTFPLMVTGLGLKIGNDNTSSFNVVEVKLNDQALIANNS